MGETFVVAEQDKPTLRQLYVEIRKRLGASEKIKTVPKWVDRLARTREYNTTKINSLGWKAKIGMEEAVQKLCKA